MKKILVTRRLLQSNEDRIKELSRMGTIPKDKKTLETMPGLGDYSASAFLSLHMNTRIDSCKQLTGKHPRPRSLHTYAKSVDTRTST